MEEKKFEVVQIWQPQTRYLLGSGLYGSVCGAGMNISGTVVVTGVFKQCLPLHRFSMNHSLPLIGFRP